MHLSTVLYNIILYPLILIIEFSFTFFNRFFANTGIAVIGVSVVVTILCLPLYAIAERWQQIERDKQKEMKPDVDVIKEVFHGDEQYMILATYYRQNHYHPLMALRSSFGLLIQIPFFMAAYSCLSNMPALKGTSFLFIRDMGEPDALFYVGSFAVNILPIAMTIINMIAGAIYTKGFPVKEKVQIYGMSVIFLVLLYDSPAGLVLYWTMNNVFSLVKNIFYKFKNPLKAFYYSSACFAGLGIIYILFFTSFVLINKLVLSFALGCIILIPLFKFVYDTFYDRFMVKAFEDKRNMDTCFIVSMALIVILLGLVIPASVISSSVQEFSFIDEQDNPLLFIATVFETSLGLFMFWPVCIYLLFSRKTKIGMSFLFMIFALMALVNYFGFAGDYGDISVTMKFLTRRSIEHSLKINVMNVVCMIACLIFAFLIARFRVIKIVKSVFVIIDMAMLILFAKDAYTINQEFNSYKVVKENSTINEVDSLSPIFHLSPDGTNVVVFMLDRAMGSLLPKILEEKPELIDDFSGFIYYPNTLSFGCVTRLGIPSVYAGYDYTPSEINKRSQEKLVDKHNEAVLTTPVIFSRNGFKTTFSDPAYVNYNYNFDSSIFTDYPEIDVVETKGPYTEMWKKQHGSKIYSAGEKPIIDRNFLWYGFFRISPTAIRSTLYDDAKWWNDKERIDDYVIDTYSLMDYLVDLTDFSASGNTYTFIENELTHAPTLLHTPGYTLEESVRDVPDDQYILEAHHDVNIAALSFVAEWLDYLKEHDVYDNTRIIIVADHGYNVHTGCFSSDFTQELMPENVNPLLMIKDFNRREKLEIDNAFMTNADVPYLSMEGLIKDPVNPFTGKPIDISQKDNGVYITSSYRWHESDNGVYTLTVDDDEWYFVHDDIFNPDNWTQEVPECL